MLSLKFLFYVLVLCRLHLASAKSDDSGELTTAGFTLSFSLPDDGVSEIYAGVIDLPQFEQCNDEECSFVCGTKDATKWKCDSFNNKLCMCDSANFYTSHLDGNVTSANITVDGHKNCSDACFKRSSYARIFNKSDKTMECICITGQLTSTGITLCDEFAVKDICKSLCQTDVAVCTFNGVCLCRSNWPQLFSLQLPHVRKQVPEDNDDCFDRCTAYHHDYRARIFDMKYIDESQTLPNNSEYKFRQKFCMCGPMEGSMQANETQAIIDQGFQVCTGLKCKRRCGLQEAVCELPFRRACLCNREGIIIGKHLWSRLPSHEETQCYETCALHGLDARVIEWNPFFHPQTDFGSPTYQKSDFQYLYDGKFCHCIQVQRDMHQYRPCTNELCKKLCNHDEAECGQQTRRACVCNTHQLVLGLGRKPDPGEINCDIACRHGLFDAMIMDVTWEVPVDGWGVKNAKYCGCVRPVSPSGLTHCDPYYDECPTYCNKPDAFCTKQKYCYCGIVDNILDNPLVRIGDGKEQDECGQLCRSWMWPLAEDTDNQPYIYDMRLKRCNTTNTCPVIDTSPWKADKPGALSESIDALEQNSNESNRRFCLCVKSSNLKSSPGTRILPRLEPERVDTRKVPCVTNHTCEVVGKGIHVIA